MPTQNVTLTPVLEALGQRPVALGHFKNASKVHHSALAAKARQEEERQLRREIQLGLEDVEAGRSAKIDSVKDLGAMRDGCLENPWHFTVYRKTRDGTVELLRVLHERMDIDAQPEELL